MPIRIARTSINGGYALRALLLHCIRIHFLLPWLTVWLKTSLLYSGRIAGDIFGTSASVIYQADLAARSRGVCLDLALRRFVQWTKNTHILRWLLRLGQHTQSRAVVCFGSSKALCSVSCHAQRTDSGPRTTTNWGQILAIAQRRNIGPYAL